MIKINNIFEVIINYICAIIMLIYFILNYIHRKDALMLTCQALLFLIFIFNSIRSTVKYKKSKKNT
ncbi:hypothetical protein [Clostridium hydrogenum]|uniref:hypothetical protein n=1 Tax=Clostridium hydrogenum TaxID=2855764 RepID=UPI001F30AA51|nr:hypothetical protein [Clostridium hydrogenum]